MQDAIWLAFRETGDPLYYMLYRALADGKAEETPKTA